MSDTSSYSAPTTADHWWWREGWGPGTRFLTWHLTFQQDEVLHAHAAAYRDLLGGFAQLDLVADHGLHMTMQGVGLATDIDAAQLAALIDAARKRLARVRPFELHLDKPAFTPEAIRWDPEPVSPVTEVRRAVRAAISEVLGSVPEAEDGFVPHVTIAYGNRVAPAGPIIAAIEESKVPPVTVAVNRADLIVLGRDRREYEWEYAAKVELGG
ncbi:2'-5' RNA ligase family protein [Actinospica robiniae]|uniref:2'-5' RNA ligase family protein n=1 Tax=Actinospica robiniae TaxID=304901 RepID=UPI000557D5CD|nr:2'-5' RNA ligase family protein [Actinospica robiniae]